MYEQPIAWSIMVLMKQYIHPDNYFKSHKEEIIERIESWVTLSNKRREELHNASCKEDLILFLNACIMIDDENIEAKIYRKMLTPRGDNES